MSISGFLGFEWKKLVVPVMFIMFFLITINQLGLYSAITDKYACNIAAEATKIKQLLNANDIASANASMKVIEELAWRMSEGKNAIIDSFSPMRNPAFFIYTIDPIFPMPCEAYYSSYFWGSGFCQYYISKDTYDCAFNVRDIGSLLLYEGELKPYSGFSVPLVLLNILLLFAEGYLISCAVLSFGRWFRSKYHKNREWGRLIKRWSKSGRLR